MERPVRRRAACLGEGSLDLRAGQISAFVPRKERLFLRLALAWMDLISSRPMGFGRSRDRWPATTSSFFGRFN